MKKSVTFLVVLLSAFLSFGKGEISDFCQSKIDEFVTRRVELKSVEDHKLVVEIIDQLHSEAESRLADFAIDYEQEKQLLENMYFMETYDHRLTKENRGQLRKEMKKRMKDSHKIIESRKESQLSEWFYVCSADVTSYFMSRSVAATIIYALKVKEWYKKAVKKDSTMTAGNSCLANWEFFAPKPFGSKRRARQHYESALLGARTPGEKYMVYTYYSQFLYEEKNFKEAEKYLQMAYDLNLGTVELDLMKKCNEEGISFFQHMRKISGIDEDIPESEKEAEDK